MRLPHVVVCMLLMAACGAPDGTASPELREGTVELRSERNLALEVRAAAPIKLGKNELVVTFPSGPPGAAVELVQASALMPAHGHGSKPPTIEKVGEGYRVTNLVLYMSGRWEVRFALRVDGHDDEALVGIGVP